MALDIIPGNRRMAGNRVELGRKGVHGGENMTEALRLSNKFCAVEPLWERESRELVYSPPPTFLLSPPIPWLPSLVESCLESVKAFYHSSLVLLALEQAPTAQMCSSKGLRSSKGLID